MCFFACQTWNTAPRRILQDRHPADVHDVERRREDLRAQTLRPLHGFVHVGHGHVEVPVRRRTALPLFRAHAVRSGHFLTAHREHRVDLGRARSAAR